MEFIKFLFDDFSFVQFLKSLQPLGFLRSVFSFHLFGEIFLHFSSLWFDEYIALIELPCHKTYLALN